MNNLEALQKANPHITIHSIHEDVFKRYGSVIKEDTTAFCAAAETLPFPEEGSKYVDMAFSFCIGGICVHREEMNLHCGASVFEKMRLQKWPPSLPTLNPDRKMELGGWPCLLMCILAFFFFFLKPLY